MTDQKNYHLHRYVVAAAALFSLTHLTWEYTHGGVVSHHLFASPDMPAFSNWWGLVILPVMGWFASWSVLRRAGENKKVLQKAFVGTLSSLLIGIVLSVSFTTGYEQIASYIFFGALLSGLIVPIYRAEYGLGFVLGMTFTFGSVLPTLFWLIGAGISAIFHLLIRPGVKRVVSRIRA